MTYERCVIENLFRMWDSRDPNRIAENDWEFGHALYVRPEDSILTAEERERVWSIAQRHRDCKLSFFANKGLEEWIAQCEEEKSFRHALSDNTEDFGLRLIYADWLAEQGRNEMEQAQRLMVKMGIAPTLSACGSRYIGGKAEGMNFEWRWGMDMWRIFQELGSNSLSYWNHSQISAEVNLAKAIVVAVTAEFKKALVKP